MSQPIRYNAQDTADITSQFQDPGDVATPNPQKFQDLVPDWLRTDEAYGTRASTSQAEIPQPTASAWPFVDYRTYGVIPSAAANRGYPYYRNLVSKFGAPLPKTTASRRAALRIPVNPSADPSAKPERPNTSWEYTGNYFEILTHLIPDEYRNVDSPKYDPDFHFINMSDHQFYKTKIKGKYGYNASTDSVARDLYVPSKDQNVGHEEYMDKLFKSGILVYPAEHQSNKGHQRSKRLRQVIQNLYKLTVKMDNFSELSELSRVQQVTIEEYALQTRKMFYILTFLKDQMKTIDKQEGELQELITAMTAKTQQFERLLGKKQFNKFRQKTVRLKEDRKAIESLTKYATESILRRFKKLGISVDGVTDLDGPLPGESNDMIRWDTFKQMFDKEMQGDSEVRRLKSEYVQSVQGRGERLHVLLDFDLPGNQDITKLPQAKRESLKVFLEHAFDTLTSAPIDEGYEMLTQSDYQTIGVSGGGSREEELSISIDSNTRNDSLIKDLFAEYANVSHDDVAVVNYNHLYGGADDPADAPANPPGDAPANPPENPPDNPPENAPANPPENAPANPPENAPANPPENAPATPPENAPANPPENAPGDAPADTNSGSNNTGSTPNSAPDSTSNSKISFPNPSQTGATFNEKGMTLYLQGVSPSQLALDGGEDKAKQSYVDLLKEHGIDVDKDKITFTEGYDNKVASSKTANQTPPANPPADAPANTPADAPANPPADAPANTPPNPPADAPAPPSNHENLTDAPAPPTDHENLTDAPAPQTDHENLTDTPAPGSGGFLSNNRFTKFLKNLVGGASMGVNIPVAITPANFAQVQQLVNEGNVPQWFQDEYNAYTSRPQPDPSKPGRVLNLPHEPWKPTQLEVVIKLPKNAAEKAEVLSKFGEKQILSRLKQNLATRLGNYKNYSSEYKDIKGLLESMAMNTNWLKNMKIESMGQTKGIQVNPDQPSASWIASTKNITDFNTKLFDPATLDPANHTKVAPNGDQWGKYITEGSEGKVSKALVDIARWDDEIADDAVGAMQEVVMDLDSIGLGSPQDKLDYIVSLGLDPDKIKEGREELAGATLPDGSTFTGGVRRTKKRNKSKQFVGGKIKFTINKKDLLSQIEKAQTAATSAEGYTYIKKDGTETKLTGVSANFIEKKAFNPASAKAAEQAAKKAENMKRLEEEEKLAALNGSPISEQSIPSMESLKATLESIICVDDPETRKQLRKKFKDLNPEPEIQAAIDEICPPTGGYKKNRRTNKKKSIKKRRYYKNK